MAVLVEDSPRNNLASWASETQGVEPGLIDGVVLSPFATPVVGNSYKQSAAQTVDRLHDAGLDVWLDPGTHAHGMPGVGDFRYYDGWDLWGGTSGDLSSRATQRDHVSRVLEAAARLQVKPIAPSVLLTSATGANSVLAASLAEEALRMEPEAWLTVAGSPAFWADGTDLDAFVGVLAQMNPQGACLVVVRPTADMPPAIHPSEVAGICRTARSLEQFGHVHVSHGDYLGLPAVAAGAASVGSGWDIRQRVCNYTSYVARDPNATGGGWLKRPSFAGLFGTIGRGDAERLERQSVTLSRRLHPGPLHPDAPKEAFVHHLANLKNLIDALVDLDFEPAYRHLDELYDRASIDWPAAAAAADIDSLASHWIDPLRTGLRAYGHDEGWV